MIGKRCLRIHLTSPDDDIMPEELHKLSELLNSMEDWQLAGERDEDVKDFIIDATYDTEL